MCVQVVKARVIAVDAKFVTLDPGYKYTQSFFKRELAGVPIYAEDGESVYDDVFFPCVCLS